MSELECTVGRRTGREFVYVHSVVRLCVHCSNALYSDSYYYVYAQPPGDGARSESPRFPQSLAAKVQRCEESGKFCGKEWKVLGSVDTLKCEKKRTRREPFTHRTEGLFLGVELRRRAGW